MIKKADVGVGIFGHEGSQATLNSDFAFCRFYHLRRLLLVHGHWSYSRYARMALLVFYKQIVLISVSIQYIAIDYNTFVSQVWNLMFYWYQLLTGFSSQVPVSDLYQQLHAVTFTSLMPIMLAIFDQVLPAETLYNQPHLYTYYTIY